MEWAAFGTFTVGKPERFVLNEKSIALTGIRFECKCLGIIYTQVAISGETIVTGSTIEGDQCSPYRKVIGLDPQDETFGICQCQSGNRQAA